MKKRISLFAVVAVSTLLVACGGDDSSGDATASTTVTTNATGPESSDPDDGLPDSGLDDGDLLAVFQRSDLFSTLLSAATAAGLIELLDGEVSYTFFAPANKAFDDLPTGVLDKLLKPENRAILIEILKYHMVPGSLPTTVMTNGDLVSLQGSPISIEVFQTNNFTELLKVNGKFSVIPNLSATNGIVHIINWIMLPPGIDLNTL